MTQADKHFIETCKEIIENGDFNTLLKKLEQVSFE